MIKNFIKWVEGVIEDFPIPYEVKNIYFCLHKETNFYCYLSFGGNEFDNQKFLLNFQYYPLDAQFFSLPQKLQNFNLVDLRILLQKAITAPQFFSHFLNKNIFYGIFTSTEIYKLD